MKTLCYSVRLQGLTDISEKAYKAVGFDGSEAIIPKSQVFGEDFEVQKSQAFWISAWILEKKDLQYSSKKSAWFNESGEREPTYTVEHFTPKSVSAVESNEIEELRK